MSKNIKHFIETEVNKVRAFSFFIAEWLLLKLVKGTPSQASQKILIVRLDAIGDFILWIEAAKELRRLYPKYTYSITLLGNKLWSDLATDLDVFDEIWSLDKPKFFKNIAYRLSMLLKVRKAGFSTAIQPTYSREFAYGDLIINASSAHERIGSEGDASNINLWQKRISDRWYTRLISLPHGDNTLIGNAEFMRGLGSVNFKAGIPVLPVSVKVPLGINDRKYYVIFPGAGAVTRQWPIENFKNLVNRIYRKTGLVGLVCGGGGEELLGEELENHSEVPLLNYVGKTSLRELVAIIAGAQFLVSNETSAVHIAAAVSTFSVCILGGGHFGRFLPYHLEEETCKPLPVAVIHEMECFGCNWQCRYCSNSETVAPCISQVTVNDVWSVVARVISASASVPGCCINFEG